MHNNKVMKKALFLLLVSFIANCSFACECGIWGQLLVKVPAGSARYDCGSTIEWNCNQPLSFTNTYQCTPNNASCQAKTTWEVKTAAGVILKSGIGTSNLSGGFNLPSSGSYTLTLNTNCNGIICKPCVYTIIANCSSSCECGTWGQLLVRVPSGSARYDCYSQINWKTNQPLSFTCTYQCSPKNAGCQAKTTWEVKSAAGAVIKSGTGTSNLNDGFNLPSNGIYSLTLNANCNGIMCKPCVYKIVIQ